VLPIGALGPLIGTPTWTWLPLLQKYLSHELVDSSLATNKAVKRDDADVPSHLWNQRCLLVLLHLGMALPILQEHLSNWVVHDITWELCAFLVCQHGLDWLVRLLCLHSYQFQERSAPARDPTRGESDELSERDGKLIEDVSAGVDILRQFAESDWWSWEDGSTLVFW
jgi:hypothetical protein